MIEHLKSGLSVSTHVGCPMGCVYCVLSSMEDFNKTIRQSMTPIEIMEELKKPESLFMNGETPLIVNNRTDPFLPQVTSTTLELLSLLAKNQISSPVLLISKFAPPKEIREFFETLQLLYFYSYSAIESDFNFARLEEDLELIAGNVPKKRRFHYFRPIINGYNDNPDQIQALLWKFYKADFAGSVITGLRITSNNEHMLQEKIAYDSQHKYLDKNLFAGTMKQLVDHHIPYAIYRHTSCAIAACLQKANKLCYYQLEGHCNPSCRNGECCEKREFRKVEESELIKILGADTQMEILKDRIIINSMISQEQVAYLKNVYGVKVEAKRVSLSPSEKEILGQ